MGRMAMRERVTLNLLPLAALRYRGGSLMSMNALFYTVLRVHMICLNLMEVVMIVTLYTLVSVHLFPCHSITTTVVKFPEI